MTHRDAPLLGRAEDRMREVLARATATRGSRRVPVQARPVAPPVRELSGVIGDCAVYRRGARRPGALPLAEAGAAARGADGFVWIGLRQPTPDEVAEVAVFVGPHFVVTVRHGDSDVLRQVRTELDTGAGDLPARGPLGVLYRAADPVVDQYEHAVEGITEDVDEIESQVFGGSDEDHSERIYKLKREVAEFRRAAMPLAIR